jgi:hypothetical protein
VVRYVDSVASQQVPPPYHFPQTTVRAFIWEPKLQKVKDYCKKFFNIGDLNDLGITYEPLALWPYAALMIIDYPIMACGDPARKSMSEIPYSERGYTSQKEMFVTFPVLRRGRNLRRLAFDTVVEWAIPFIAVENPMSAICGREMLGLEKLCGSIDVAKSDVGLFSATVCLPGWPSMASTVKQEILPFFEVRAEPAWTIPDGESMWSLLRSPAASRAVAALGVMRDVLDGALMGLLPTVMRVVSLKQFRSAVQPGQAVYQALVSCRSTYSDITDFTVYNEKNSVLAFHNCGSFCNIIEEVFDAPKNESVHKGDDKIFELPVIAAFEFGARIDFDEMRTLHTFPVDGSAGPRSADDWTSPWLTPWRGFVGGARR